MHNMLTRVAADKTLQPFLPPPPAPLQSTKDKIRATKSNHTEQYPLVQVYGPLCFVRDQGLKAQLCRARCCWSWLWAHRRQAQLKCDSLQEVASLSHLHEG